MCSVKAVAALTITGFEGEPESITDILGVSPSKTWRIGEPIIKTQPSFRCFETNGWRLAYKSEISKPDDAMLFQKVLAELVEKVSPLRDKFSRLPIGSETEISCHIYLAQDFRPIVSFDAETIRFIADIKASIDIDVYVVD